MLTILLAAFCFKTPSPSVRPVAIDKSYQTEASRSFLGPRAFPNASVDWSEYSRATAHAAQMKPADLAQDIHALTGQSWNFVGPTGLAVPARSDWGFAPVSGRVNAVAYDPNNSQTIYAGSAQGGLFKSADSGVTWSPMSNSWPQLAVSTIAVDPNDSNTIYVGLGDYPAFISNSFGIMKTSDGGAHWNEIATAFMGQVGVAKILIDPTNDQNIIVGTGDHYTEGALYRSTNGGTTWQTVIPNDSTQPRLWPTIAASALNGGAMRMYAIGCGWGNKGTPTSRLYVSDDHGATWQNIPSPINSDGNFHRAYWVCTSPSHYNNVYVLDSENAKFYSSNDQGATWLDLSPDLPNDGVNFSATWYNYYVECGTKVVGASATDLLYLGEIDLNVSADGGHSWKSIGGPSYDDLAIVHDHQHALAISPIDINKALFSGDGGVYASAYNSATDQYDITNLNATLGVTMINKIAAHPTNDKTLIGGAEDNGIPLAAGVFSDWSNVGGYNSGGCAINQSNPLISYATSQFLGVLHTTDGWNTQNDISPSPGADEHVPFIAPLVLAPGDQTKMYTGTNFLYVWDEKAQKWTAKLGNQDLTAGGSTAYIQAIAVAPSDVNRIYTGSSDGALWASQDRGATWIQLNAGSTVLPNLAITSISVSALNPGDILIGFSGTGSGHLWRCSNTSAITPVFTSVSGNGTNALPNVSLNAIARDLDNPTTTWWVAMDVGVFRSSDSGVTWTNAGAAYGLPNVIVSDLVIVPGTRYINAGTYGRGIWRLYLPTTGGTLSNFTLAPTTVVSGGKSTGTLTLAAPAPTGGIFINLASSDASLASVPAQIYMSAGATVTTFAATTVSAIPTSGTVIISAVYNGVTINQNLNVTAVSPTGLTIAPVAVSGGTSATATVTLNTAAPVGGVVVNLKSNSTSATVPTTMTVSSGTNTGTFPVNTTSVGTVTVATITASTGTNSVTQILTVNPPSLTGVTLSPTAVPGGAPSTATIQLSGQAPVGGISVGLSSSSPTVTTPATIMIPAGSTYSTVTLSTTSVSSPQSATLTATLAGVQKTAILIINPPVLSSIALVPSSVGGGSPSIGTVTVLGTAPTGGLTVGLSSSSSSATVPASVMIAAGASTATFTVSTSGVSNITTATITATLSAVSKTATLTITPTTLSGISITPSTVAGGASAIGTLSLSGIAGQGGVTVSLTSSTSSAKVPTSVTIPAGATSGTFSIATSMVSSSVTATITASLGGQTGTATLTIQPVSLVSMSLSTNSVVGGSQTTVSGTLTFNGPTSASGIVVNLSSSNTSAATVPASIKVTLTGSSRTATFTVTHLKVGAATSTSVKASAGGVSDAVSLSVNPFQINSVSISPSSVAGGTGAKGVVTLNAAPGTKSGVIAVKLVSSAKAATVPATVSVGIGSTTGNFSVTTTAVASDTSATVTASYAASSKQATLNVLAPVLVLISVSSASVKGSSTTKVTGTVTLSGPAPTTGLVVNLTSSASHVAGIPATVKIASGKTTGTFTVGHLAVSSNVAVTLTATLGQVSKTTTLTVTP